MLSHSWPNVLETSTVRHCCSSLALSRYSFCVPVSVSLGRQCKCCCIQFKYWDSYCGKGETCPLPHSKAAAIPVGLLRLWPPSEAAPRSSLDKVCIQHICQSKIHFLCLLLSAFCSVLHLPTTYPGMPLACFPSPCPGLERSEHCCPPSPYRVAGWCRKASACLCTSLSLWG